MKAKKIADDLAKELIDKGFLLEAGFEILASMAMPKNASERQVKECKLYFMAGAQHLFASIMQSLEAGSEPTDTDLRRMENINTELDVWKAKIEARFNSQNRTMQ